MFRVSPINSIIILLEPQNLVIAFIGLMYFSLCSGLKALNNIVTSSEGNYSGEQISFVTVFTTYSSVQDGDGKVPFDTITVGNHSYSKIERSMAILNTFISFIKVTLPLIQVSVDCSY